MSDSLSGKDAVQLDQHIFADLADEEAVKVSFPNEKMKMARGKNENVIIAKNEAGEIADVELRIMVGSLDQAWLNSRMLEQDNDFSAFIPLTCVFSKRVGDGSGKLHTVVYQGTAGAFQMQADASTNSSGDTNQSVAVYKLRFGSMKVSIQ